VPSTSGRGSGPFSVDHLDVFAMTIAPGMAVPANRVFLQKPHTIATLPVRPVDPDEADGDSGRGASDDHRPAPGDTVTFVETLSEAALQPTVIVTSEKPAKPAKPSKGAAPAPVATAPPAPVGPPVLTRFYAVRGVTKGGRPGGPSARLSVPLLAAPAAPRRGGSPSWSAAAVTITWDPPPSRTDEASGVTYNVYPAPSGEAAGDSTAPPVPLNPAPLEATTFTHEGAEPDKEQCFVVRSVASLGAGAGDVAIESDASEPICVTPKDTIPPAAPKSVAAVGSAGVINLIWDANSEADLAGYLVLRGDVPGGTLQPLMREPIKETRYADRTARPGVRYAYEVIAVDKAGNRSPSSNRVEEAAR
jgi:hypothetical protein